MYSPTIRNYNRVGIDPKKSSFTRYQSIHVTFFDENGNWDVESRVCNSSFLVAEKSL